MRYGHPIDSDIPESSDEAEFPPLPWGKEVTIRVRAQLPPAQPLAPLPADGGSPDPLSVPGSPATWTGPALGQAPPIDPDAAALVGYDSTNQTVDAPQEPDDPELMRLRGLSCCDEELHKTISWTTLKDYPTLIGISLPIKDWGGEDFREIQFWEDTIDPIQFLDTPVATYDWLMTRLRSRAANQN
jgi:hypothetical protein